ncbi:MAG: FUSC family protein [Acidobacteria bacterium]|nr:FUSC family protein [Acidobacteriota bacterium]
MEISPNSGGPGNPSRPSLWPVIVHSARTAVTALASILVARLFRLPESYWAPITTLVITQSSVGAALKVSGERFVGTVLGAAVGAVVGTLIGPSLIAFGAGVFILGLLSAAAHSSFSAYRFAGVTLAVVQLIPRNGPPWLVAFHRFATVTIGVAVALAMAVVWPEQDETVLQKAERVRKR